MRTILRLIALSTAPLFGCGVLPPAAPPAPPFDTAMSIKQLMEWVVDPAVDVIWDSVTTIYTEAGTKEVAPHTDAQLAAVRNRRAAS